MITVISDVANFAAGATENASKRTGLFVRLLRALHETHAHEARRVIIKYAYLLPEARSFEESDRHWPHA